jgi:ATP-dependent Lon protease
MDEVLAKALTRKPEPIEWDETKSVAGVPNTAADDEAASVIAH